MPKMKTRKCVAKRLKRTGTGKYMHYKTGRRHIQSKKSAKRKRQLRGAADISHSDLGRVTRSLPYGLA